VIALAVLGSTDPAVLVASGSGLLAAFVTMALTAWRRISTEWSFTVAEAPDGLRVRSGLLSRAAETVPRAGFKQSAWSNLFGSAPWWWPPRVASGRRGEGR